MKSTKIICKHCEGKGHKDIAETLETVLRELKQPHHGGGPWLSLKEIRLGLESQGIVYTPASLNEKLGKLVEHDLAEVTRKIHPYVRWRLVK